MIKELKNPGVINFTGTIYQSDRARNSSAWVEFRYDLNELYGKGNLVPAIITFDGIEYRGSITKMGGEYPLLLIRRDILAKLKKSKGDRVEVTVTLDDKPRTVIIPQELEAEFKQNETARNLYNKLSYTHRKEYASWVSEAKKPETRQKRATKSIDMIISKES